MNPRQQKGFTLVEVVLAVGVVAFSLLAIFGLLGSALQSSADTLGETEALNARETLNNHLRSHWSGTNFASAYQTLRAETFEDIYVLSFTDPQGDIAAAAMEPADADLAARAANRTGRLLRARLRVSPNFLPLGVEQTVGSVQASDLPANPQDFPNAMLGVTVEFYQVPDVTADIPSAQRPILRYDTAISR